MSEDTEHGNRGRGRPPGAKNKNRYDVLEKLQSAGCDPVTEMVQMLRDPDIKSEIKANLLTNLVKYVAPQKKAVEVSGDEDAPLMIKFAWEDDSEDSEDEDTPPTEENDNDE